MALTEDVLLSIYHTQSEKYQNLEDANFIAE